jgi:Fic family protein
MNYNWEKPDWPNFTWDPSRLTTAEEKFLVDAGVVLGTVKHLDESQHDQLLVEVMSVEALKTSAIEGEVLNRASVQSSVLRQFGLASPDKRRVLPSEQGIAEMMVNLYRTFSQPLSDLALRMRIP